MRTRRECDQEVKMEVAEFVRGESFVHTDFSEYLARLEPVFFRRRQDWMVSLERPQEFMLCGLGSATP